MLDQYHQPPRSAQHAQGLVVEPRLRQEGWGQFLQLCQCIVQVASRQFLGAYLQYEARWRVGICIACCVLRVACFRLPASCFRIQPGILHPLSLFGIRLCHLPGEVAHTTEVGRPLCHADSASRVEQVEGVGAAQDVVVGGGDQTRIQTTACLGLVQVVHLGQPLHIGQLEGIAAVLNLRSQEDIAVGVGAVPIDLPDRAHVLQEHHDSL